MIIRLYRGACLEGVGHGFMSGSAAWAANGLKGAGENRGMHMEALTQSPGG